MKWYESCYRGREKNKTSKNILFNYTVNTLYRICKYLGIILCVGFNFIQKTDGSQSEIWWNFVSCPLRRESLCLQDELYTHFLCLLLWSFCIGFSICYQSHWAFALWKVHIEDICHFSLYLLLEGEDPKHAGHVVAQAGKA